jgi:DNA polymerase I-like protein with 3'-5' exonuclease and polymerase domains
MSPFKDLAELHVAAVGSAQPDMFKTVLNSVRWASSLSLPIRGNDGDDTLQPKRLEVVKFAERPAPAPREFVVEGFIPRYHPTTVYGWGGTTKSIQVMLLAMCVAGRRPTWLDIPLHVHGPALYLDFELEADEQQRRVEQLAAGMNITVPSDLNYISALGFSSQEAFAYAQEVCKEQGVVLLVVDSLGPAMLGDMGSAKDVIAFHSTYIAPFRALGVTPLLIDHQARQQAGESYQNKGTFGSAYKEHLSRSLVQIEGGGKGAEENVLTVRVRHKKTNFSALRDPFEVQITFSKDAITTEARELDSEDLSAEQTLNATERVTQALKVGPAFSAEIEDKTGLALGTVKNVLTRLKKQGRVEETGEKDKTGSHQVQLVVLNPPGEKPVKKKEPSEEPAQVSSLSLRYRGSDDDDTFLSGAPVYINTVEELDSVAAALKPAPVVGVDTETYPQDETARSLDPRRGQVGVISLADPSGNSYVIDSKLLPKEDVRQALETAIGGKDIVTHNGAAFDLAFLRRTVGYEHFGKVYDTLILDAMLFYATGPLTTRGNWRGLLKKDKEEGYRRSLEEVARLRLGIKLDKDQRERDWDGDLTQEMIEYAGRDAAVLIPLKDYLVTKLEDVGMGAVVDVEARFTPSMAYCSDNGFALDIEGWKKHATEALKIRDQAAAECDRLAGDPPEDISGGVWGWSASNHHKVGRALKKLGATVSTNEETGNYMTSEAELKKIKSPKKAVELVEAILKYRSVEKYVTTWGENWFKEPRLNKKGKIAQGSPDHLIVVDGRAYTKLNQLVATGRGSSRYPNFQNIPPELRELFVAPPGRCLLIGDYSQIEYVAAAFLAGDEALLELLREALADPTKKFDFHTTTSRMILEGARGQSVTEDEVEAFRGAAKTINFAVLYGMSAENLATKLTSMGIETDKKQAELYIELLFSEAVQLADWHKTQIKKAKKGVEFATTNLGRRRLVDQNYRGGRWRSSATQMLNSPIQGVCADGYKLAGALLWERRHEFPGNPLLVNMVHDEFVQEIDQDAALEGARLLEQIMVEGMKDVLGKDAPVAAKVVTADHWIKD